MRLVHRTEVPELELGDGLLIAERDFLRPVGQVTWSSECLETDLKCVNGWSSKIIIIMNE